MVKKIGILFDCDGTLLDSLGNAFDSFDYAFDQIGEPRQKPENIKKFFGTSADRIFINLMNDSQLALKAFEFYLDHQAELALKTKLHHGIEELLEALLSKNIPLAIVTGRHAKDLENVLRPHDIKHFFKSIIADSDVTRSKPAPDGLLLALSQMGIDSENSFYLGDSPTDIQAAHNAQSKSVAVLWDKTVDKLEMEKVSPHFLINHPHEMLDLLLL
ncbi:MAG: hypothetical protein COW00_08875 [Bdellovibrio sp. CG12_big_fil_rev_8_21_14_0_65_39_13]|nr:MAG: hypothetical protein COW78_08945 [Bdellovibrio sp. CG22_combo_CG10-13_8_21_14_all_39_27]PIQ59737.1 MAG: hypothetical protein COW00_08875 [Bdellovibrio sp. CG12_big_fil_rev_8_21_14_0_65_39_13]PIR36233.1 MAG: hypothetical protein COV37_04510 [Bdellovibrio sp. CG11_big_fil_rev_8_21_14_0_20_39_38]